jgi:uncharacterized protein involved in exopolysaccharide biosynthesis
VPEYYLSGVKYPAMETTRKFWRARPASSEEVENETAVTVEAKLPRRLKVILIPALLAPLAGYGVSYLFPPKYTSQALVLVEAQEVPEEYVKPIITADFTQRVQTLSQQVLSPARLRPMIESLGLVKPDDESKLIEDIQQNVAVEPVIASMSGTNAEGIASAEKRNGSASDEPVPGFRLTFTDSDAARAQKICNALTELIVNENLRERAAVTKSVTEFLSQQLAEAKRTLDEQDAKLAAFKKQYMGKLPTDTRTAMSPSIEEQYKMLTRDNDVNEAFYKDLLAKKNAAYLGASMENQQLGEQMRPQGAASLPDAPAFPNRPPFALWGLGAGLLVGIGLALWPIRKATTEPQAAILHSDSA